MAERNEDDLFVLRMMKFIFNVKSVIFPEYLHDMLEKYRVDEPSYFTSNLTEATLILMEIEESRRNYTDIDELFFYSTETHHLMNNFNCRDFFKFCVRYGTQSVSDYLGGKINAPSIVFNCIVRIIENCRSDRLFNAGTWVELDQYAQLIIARSRDENITVPETESSSGNDEEELQDKRCAEKEFVLKVMKHVFNLHLKELPSPLEAMLEEFSKNAHPYFSPTVKAAIEAELNIEATSLRRVQEQDLEDYYERQLLKDFRIKVFLEGCVCFSKKAMREYYDECRSTSPRNIYAFLTMRLGIAREKNRFTTWEDMEQAAIDTVAEYEARLESDREKRIAASLGEDALNFADSVGVSVPLRAASPEVGCPGCRCN